MVVLRLVVVYLAVCVLTPDAWSQTLSFLPSPDQARRLTDNTDAITGYDLQVYADMDQAPFFTTALGKPAPAADGRIAIDVAPMSGSWPTGVLLTVRVVAVGRAGRVASDVTAQSTFSLPYQGVPPSCTYTLAATATTVNWNTKQGSVGLSTTTSCAWSATTNASWIMLGVAGGVGPQIVTFSMQQNRTRADRIGLITIATRSYSVTQRGR